MPTYKVVDLFGNETIKFSAPTARRPDLFSHYDAFTEKFEAKKTTDDCYTPPEVFEIVLNYVSENYDLTDKEIIRPFYPGGDFEGIDYPENAVIIDNPPFSIISKIARFYIEKQIPFFLFAPHLTLFGSDIDCTHIVVGADLIYANGANVKTSFLSNMFGDAKIIGEAALSARFKELNERNKVNLPRYEYPTNVVTVSNIAWLVERGVSIQIPKSEARFIRALDSQRPHGKALFGSGFLVSDRAAAEKAEKVKQDAIIWELSQKERKIIESLTPIPCNTL